MAEPVPIETPQEVVAEPSAKAPAQKENDFPFAVSVGTVYEGPLDLLLDLIRKQDIDIYDIPIARITAQYLTYVERMRATYAFNARSFLRLIGQYVMPEKELRKQKPTPDSVGMG